MKMDLSNTKGPDLLYKKSEPIEPLFYYQRWALANIKRRTVKTTVFSYDSTGNVKNRYPRAEIDTALYLSIASKDLGGVTSFPFFSIKDSTDTNGNNVRIKSVVDNINYYLKEVEMVIDPATKQVKRIQS